MKGWEARSVLQQMVTLSNITIDEWDDSGGEHHVKASWSKPKSEIHHSPRCRADSPDLSGAGESDRKLYDEPLRKPVYIELNRQRYRCQRCGKELPSHPDIYRDRKNKRPPGVVHLEQIP